MLRDHTSIFEVRQKVVRTKQFFYLTIFLQLFGEPCIKYIQGAIKKYRTNETDILRWRLYIYEKHKTHC